MSISSYTITIHDNPSIYFIHSFSKYARQKTYTPVSQADKLCASVKFTFFMWENK